MSLTPLGVQQQHEVVATVYAHIRALRALTEEQVGQYWRDLGVCDWLDFHYKQVQHYALRLLLVTYMCG